MRKETDFIGELEIPESALYGIQSMRAKENFPYASAFHPKWYQAMGTVKLAMFQCIEKFQHDAQKKYGKIESLNVISQDILSAMSQAAAEISESAHYEHFIVPAVQGGAGTSINMNVNEIIANRALEILQKSPGDYHTIHPIEYANRYQSTNDVVPTALRVAVMQMLNELEDKINQLRFGLETKEKAYRDSLRTAYTQMQEAVPSTFGKLFSAYNDALSRDWWRVSKCFERIKLVNLGGSATGTGLTVPRYIIMEAVRELQKITKLPVTRSENLGDATANLDAWVEIHGILKAHAVNLEKISSDLRLLAADINKDKSLKIPQKQIGSSIMPGKVNPVISEYLITIAHKVYANDQLISGLSGQGVLDLNPYLPEIGDAMLESLSLLLAGNESLLKHLISGMQVNSENSKQQLYLSASIATALIPLVGYTKAGELAQHMREYKIDIFAANAELKLVDVKKLNKALQAENLMKLGFTIGDLLLSE
ncbi:MAG: lyase family protein [Bacteroidales bacterium]|jgi:aspartate ammonia-lyase|nr:lyase family protein [Bacteroidales bacterium]